MFWPLVIESTNTKYQYLSKWLKKINNKEHHFLKKFKLRINSSVVFILFIHKISFLELVFFSWLYNV